ncbi:hypothetical protein PC128_g12709, partial [Phytophthora cactorum]
MDGGGISPIDSHDTCTMARASIHGPSLQSPALEREEPASLSRLNLNVNLRAAPWRGPRPEEEEQQQETDAESAQATEENDDSVPEVVVIELPAKEKLGVKLMPPKDGVIDHGLAIDNINNPLLENKVQAGDLIVAIGGQNVDGMGFSDAIDLIRKMPRSLAISFEIDEVRRQEVVREKFQQNKDDDLDKELTTYAVVFDNGPMGLNLEEAVR